MKKEEVIILEKNGVNRERIVSLSKSLKGYYELKKELKNMQDIIKKEENEIKIRKKINKLERSRLLKKLK